MYTGRLILTAKLITGMQLCSTDVYSTVNDLATDSDTINI